ncbi:MAG: hypothetical protein QXH01_07080, partial [Thermofilum sp.]
FFLSCILRAKKLAAVNPAIKTFNSFLVASEKSENSLKVLLHTFNSFLVASEIFYPGGVYMFNV